MNPPDPKFRSVPAAEALAEVTQLVPQLTDEEWEARDRAIAANEARLTAVPLATRLAELGELGFPRRHRELVRRGVDLALPAVARLRADDAYASILVLSGPKGCGKTAAVTWWAAQRRDRVRFVRAARFASTSRYDRDARAERDDWYSGPLVVDDLGAEYADNKGNLIADVDELIDVFYSEMLPLVVTTNCTVEQFRERYGERVADRLRECGRWISVAIPSLRRRRGEDGPA